MRVPRRTMIPLSQIAIENPTPLSQKSYTKPPLLIQKDLNDQGPLRIKAGAKRVQFALNRGEQAILGVILFEQEFHLLKQALGQGGSEPLSAFPMGALRLLQELRLSGLSIDSLAEALSIESPEIEMYLRMLSWPLAVQGWILALPELFNLTQLKLWAEKALSGKELIELVWRHIKKTAIQKTFQCANSQGTLSDSH